MTCIVKTGIGQYRVEAPTDHAILVDTGIAVECDAKTFRPIITIAHDAMDVLTPDEAEALARAVLVAVQIARGELDVDARK